MAEFYEMPAVSPTMEVGVLVEWRVKEGESFESGAVVAEVGTDKANMEAEIFDNGVLIKHLVAEDDEVPPGYPIAIWGSSADEDISGLLEEFEQRKAKAASGGAEASDDGGSDDDAGSDEAPAKAPAPSASRPEASGTVERSWEGREVHHDFYDPPGDIRFGGDAATTTTDSGAEVKASPLARKVAQERGVDLSRVEGTGPGGRIVRADVESAPTGPVAGAGRPSRSDETVKNSPMRKTIARRLLESHQDIPTFFLTTSFDMQGFVDLRSQLKAQLPDVKVSYNDILIKAVAASLVEHPEVNASWGDKAITQHGRVDIGVAVALPQGLITPVVRNADQLGLAAIATTVRELAGRARDQKLSPDEYTGGTFTISNLGMMEIEHFTAIINPPEAAILAVGAITPTPVVHDGELVVEHRMKVTMTCDHRVIDGAVGAAFLQTLRRYVENPYLLLV
jgi:pyruvate dehydrogenase E2 component (dihydrolipoamide acetyltransferase)